MVTYRKTREGIWVACGPAEQVRAGAQVTVTRRDGSTQVERIASTGGVFLLNGAQYVYGYLTPRQQPGVQASRRRGCSQCGSSACPRAWDPRDLCDED